MSSSNNNHRSNRRRRGGGGGIFSAVAWVRDWFAGGQLGVVPHEYALLFASTLLLRFLMMYRSIQSCKAHTMGMSIEKVLTDIVSVPVRVYNARLIREREALREALAEAERLAEAAKEEVDAALAAIQDDEAGAGTAAGWVERAQRLVKAREDRRDAEEKLVKAREDSEKAEGTALLCICGTCASCTTL